jgi:hypothetical protein
MRNKPKVVPLTTPPVPTGPRALADHGVLRNQIIVSIGPVVLAVDYAVRITALKGVPRDGAWPCPIHLRSGKAAERKIQAICVGAVRARCWEPATITRSVVATRKRVTPLSISLKVGFRRSSRDHQSIGQRRPASDRRKWAGRPQIGEHSAELLPIDDSHPSDLR